MKKFKTLLLGTMMVCSFAMLTACGKTPEVTEDALEISGNKSFNSKVSVYTGVG